MASNLYGTKPLTESFFNYLKEIIKNILQWKVFRNVIILFDENICEIVMWGIFAILFKHQRVMQRFNWHQTILGVYMNKCGKNSVAWRRKLQSIGPGGIVLSYV